MLTPPTLRLRSRVARPAHLVAGLVLAASSLVGDPARAQDSSRFDALRLQPAPGRGDGFLAAHAAELHDAMTLSAGLFFHHADRPLALIDPADGTSGNLVTSLATLHVLAWGTIVSGLDLGLDLPLTWVQRGDSIAGFRDASVTESGVVLDDLRVVPQWTIVGRRSGELGPGLALVVPLWLPTGGGDRYNHEGVRVEPRVVIDHRPSDRVRFGVDVGFLFRPDATIGSLEVRDALTWRVAGEVRVAGAVSALAEVGGEVGVVADHLGAEEIPIEALAAVRVPMGPWRLEAGAGAGLTQGFGAAKLRVIFGVAYVPAPSAREQPDPGPSAPDPILDPDPIVEPAPDPEPDPEPVVVAPDPIIEPAPEPLVVPDVVVFAYRSSEIDGAGARVIRSVAELLARRPEVSLVIAGHTDATGLETENEALASARAEAVRQALIEAGVAAGRLRAEGRGSREPRADNTTEAGRRANRRVDFEVVR